MPLGKYPPNRITITLVARSPVFTPRASLVNRLAVYLLIEGGHVKFADAEGVDLSTLGGQVRMRHGPVSVMLRQRKIPRVLHELKLDEDFLLRVAARSDLDLTRKLHATTYEYFKRR